MISPLERATELCRMDMERVDACIHENLQSDIMMIPAIGHYIVNSGGKRLRPLLSLLIARLFDYSGDRHIPLSVVVEFIHTASLLHDDVVDSSDQRRGSPSANGVWGNQASVLVGDYLFSRAFQMMVADGDMAMLKLMSDVTNALAEGEVLQLSRTFHMEMTEAECLEVIERKTAVLFKAATEVGAHVSGESADVVADLADYGMCLGVAFQLMDDALDYLAEAEEAGKPVGHDLEEGKITLPLIHAMQRDAELRKRVEDIAERGCYEDGDREWVRERVTAQDGAGYAMQRARDYAERAKLRLPENSNSEIRLLLGELADFSAHRPF
ncbi:octaprenyl-diphosphate synthase [Mariprofundus ferrinatatus]|uniref:Octaprenyl-diphosphate synthase n=2 Tax=Mariprofundus ferrinatatus TaxID=1921087 RepID=A0A2K8L9L8_9PROT|nr:octaprenyl-diphosphate synthase [Mariprofundus ferrinatatus]